MLLSWKKAGERDFENIYRLNKIIYSLTQCQKEEVLHSDNQNKISYGLKEESDWERNILKEDQFLFTVVLKVNARLKNSG